MLYKRYIKRVIDFLLSLIAIILLSPLFIIMALLIKIKLGSPIIFKQKRPGYKNKIFTIYKFRTMTNDCDSSGKLLPDANRLTKFGKTLRSSSLDELPELINIIKGDMAIVGPRPQLIRDMLFFTDEQMKRQTVRPGLTGLAQINGRNIISWEDKFKWDLVYIKNITFFGDISIVFKTIKKVLMRDNINTVGMETAEDLGDYLLRKGKIDFQEYNQTIIKQNEIY